MGWSLPKLNPVGKILGKNLVKDKWAENVEDIPPNSDVEPIWDNYVKGKGRCPNCNNVLKHYWSGPHHNFNCKKCGYAYYEHSSGIE